MGHSAMLGKSPELVVGKVARHVAQRLAVAVAAHDGLTAYAKRVVEALFAGMTEVYHYAAAVHLLNDLLAKAAHSAMSVAAAGTVADVVVAVVTERDVDNAAPCEISYVGYVVVKRQSVLYAEHYGAASLALVFIQVGRRARYAQVAVVGVYYLLYLVEDKSHTEAARQP